MRRLVILEERVKAYLAEMDLDPGRATDGLYLFKYGSTVVMITMFEEGTETFCRFTAMVLKDFQPSLELLHRILRLNAEVLFGAFQLMEDSTLSFSATLLGNNLDFDEFEKTLRYVARVSDDYDDELQALGGGLRVEDVLLQEDV